MSDCLHCDIHELLDQGKEANLAEIAVRTHCFVGFNTAVFTVCGRRPWQEDRMSLPLVL
jgi:hypothetical protein